MRDSLQILMETEIELWIAVGRKDLYISLSTQRNSIDKSIRADVNIIRFDFETKVLNRMFWIPGRCNLSDPGTKQDSPLQDTLNLALIPDEFRSIFLTSNHACQMSLLDKKKGMNMKSASDQYDLLGAKY